MLPYPRLSHISSHLLDWTFCKLPFPFTLLILILLVYHFALLSTLLSSSFSSAWFALYLFSYSVTLAAPHTNSLPIFIPILAFPFLFLISLIQSFAHFHPCYFYWLLYYSFNDFPSYPCIFRLPYHLLNLAFLYPYLVTPATSFNHC